MDAACFIGARIVVVVRLVVGISVTWSVVSIFMSVTWTVVGILMSGFVVARIIVFVTFEQFREISHVGRVLLKRRKRREMEKMERRVMKKTWRILG